jgi:hypothetical protein
MRRQSSIAGHLRAHLALAQDEVRQDRAHRFARRARDTPESEPTQADTDIRGVAGQAPAAATGRLGCALKAQGQEKGQDAFDKRLAVAQERHGGRFIVDIDGDGAVVPRPHSGLGHVSPPGHQVTSADATR